MRLALFALALVTLAPAALGQTCGGILSFGLGEPHADTLRARSASQYGVTAAGVEAERVQGARERVTGRPSLEALADREVLRDTLRRRFEGLFLPRDEVRTWTRCGFALLRYTITGADGRRPAPVMVLDLYNVPPHVSVEAASLLPFRRGRWTFDFADGGAFSAEALRRAPD